MQLDDLGQTSFGAVFRMERMYASIDLLVWQYKVAILPCDPLSCQYFLVELNLSASQAYDKWGNVICHGDKSVIKEGHKSFPSGHTSCKYL